MATLQSQDGAFFVLRQPDTQGKFDLVAIADELAHFQTGAAGLRVLFDWSQVNCWPFEAPPAAAIQTWTQTAPLIERAAIVHDPKCNRHAAILSALMRVGNAQVRSFRPHDCDNAVAWLEQGSKTNTGFP